MKPLEKRILAWARDRYPELSDQIDHLQVKAYDHTGVGLYINFLPLPDRFARNGLKSPYSGPEIQSPHVEHGACSLIWVKDGKIDCVEVAAYGDHFPDGLVEFTLAEPQGLSRPLRSIQSYVQEALI